MKKKVVKLELKCEICGQPAIGVASSAMGAISHAYCRECVNAQREVWTTLVGGLYGCGPDEVADWVKPIIEATCKFYNKTKEQLWYAVEEMTAQYEESLKNRPKEAKSE